MCRAIPSPLSCHQTLALDMLGGLAKANTGLQNLSIPDFRLLLPLDMLKGLAQRQPKGRTT
jgi:hypothetical protein